MHEMRIPRGLWSPMMISELLLTNLLYASPVLFFVGPAEPCSKGCRCLCEGGEMSFLVYEGITAVLEKDVRWRRCRQAFAVAVAL